MTEDRLRVAVIGCGNLGQHYATVYSTLPDTELVAIAEKDPERREVMGKRFGVTALYPDAEALFKEVVPDVAAVVLPGKYIKDAVVAAAEAGVKGVSSDKPLGARLSDADEMVEACEKRHIVFAGGNLQRAMYEVQEAASWIRAGEFGDLIGAAVHRWAGEISGGGCHAISVLRLFTNAEVSEVIAWARPQEVLEGNSDVGLVVNGLFQMNNGLTCTVFGEETPYGGVEVWSRDNLVRWVWGPPEIYQGFDENGARIKVDRPYSPYEWGQFHYLGSSIRSFLRAIRTGSELAISGHDLRQALEVAIAAKYSALWGSVPVKLPLEDRSLTLFPSDARWLGNDPTGHGLSLELAAEPWPGYKPELA